MNPQRSKITVVEQGHQLYQAVVGDNTATWYIYFRCGIEVAAHISVWRDNTIYMVRLKPDGGRDEEPFRVVDVGAAKILHQKREVLIQRVLSREEKTSLARLLKATSEPPHTGKIQSLMAYGVSESSDQYYGDVAVSVVNGQMVLIRNKG
jgi:hypothetical protein